MSYKDIMTDRWQASRKLPVGPVLEAAAMSCTRCDNCRDTAVANGCEATKCIICGHEIDQKIIARMNDLFHQHTCASCGVLLTVCTIPGRKPTTHIITGYCIIVSGTLEDVI